MRAEGEGRKGASTRCPGAGVAGQLNRFDCCPFIYVFFKKKIQYFFSFLTAKANEAFKAFNGLFN